MSGKRYLRPDTNEIVEVLPGLGDMWIAGTRKPNGSIKRLKTRRIPPCEVREVCQEWLDMYVELDKKSKWPVVVEEEQKRDLAAAKAARKKWKVGDLVRIRNGSEYDGYWGRIYCVPSARHPNWLYNVTLLDTSQEHDSVDCKYDQMELVEETETAKTLRCSEQDQMVTEETTSLTVRESDMGAVALNRKQRLRTLENHIRKAAEEIQKNGLEIGRDLCEIRDDELWVDECGSWNQYLKERAGELVGKSFAQAKNLIQAAEVSKRVPEKLLGQSIGLTATHFTELGRLAPTVGKDDERGAEKDYSRLRKQDVARVLKVAAELSGGESPSVRDVRKAVDAELGIDRQSKAAETKERNEAGVELQDYLRSVEGRILGITKNLAKVPGESWALLEESDPGLATRVAEACDELAELLRS